MIILICGLPGSGKTYFAKALASYMGIDHINTDSVRKSINKMSKYDRKSKDEVYDELFNRAIKIHKSKEAVIIDATFMNARHRIPYYDLSRQSNIKLKIILLIADEEIIFERLKKNRPDSEADFGVYTNIKAQFEPIERNYLALQSDQFALNEMIKSALNFIQE